MAVEAGQRLRGRSAEALNALAEAGTLLASGADAARVLDAVAEAAASVSGAELAVVRCLAADGQSLVARAVAPASSAIAAELEGTGVPPSELSADEIDEIAALPESARNGAVRAGAGAVLMLPALVGDTVVGSIELMRASGGFTDAERAGARVAAAHLALTVASAGVESRDGNGRARMLELAGEALATGGDEDETARQVVRLAAGATGATAVLLWRAEPPPELAAAFGPLEGGLDAAAKLAGLALAEWQPVALEQPDGLPGGAAAVATLPLGEPPLGVLQLLYAEQSIPGPDELQGLASFAVRVTHALRAAGRALEVSLELERSRALLTVVGQAISRLSLAHTLETAVDRIAELLDVEQVAVYLREGGALVPAAGRGLSGPDHAEAAERLLELALGPFRARGVLVIAGGDLDPSLAGMHAVLRAAKLDGAVAVPLRVVDESIGLLAAYPQAGHVLSENEQILLVALAAQLSVVVQNARLHEQATELGDALGEALASERQAARQLGALYEISRSFAQSLSLETTLEAVTRTVVEVLDVDAAVISTRDVRRDRLVPRAVHVADLRLADAVRTILERPQPFSVDPILRLFRTREPLVLDAPTAERLGGSYGLLVPFLGKGSSAAVVPIATPAEVLASLTIVSLDPARPIGEETVEAATTIGAQAALAIDNARLYQQQKEFSDTMQRSLLPRSQPEVAGLDVGAVYESSATVDVGGDVYDFLDLPDGRLAVVLGDVTGHGIEATADMAMAKFVFRSLAREHPDPGDFLAHANDVVVGEIALGKFITMAYLTIDPATGEVRCASAGHPAPRLTRPRGEVDALATYGLALGIDGEQTYEEMRETLEPGDAVVLYTDGVVEARRDRELYGTERLDETLARVRGGSADEIARAVVEDCRTYAGSEFTDDVAVVVIKRV